MASASEDGIKAKKILEFVGLPASLLPPPNLGESGTVQKWHLLTRAINVGVFFKLGHPAGSVGDVRES